MLADQGIDFEIRAAAIDETPLSNENPTLYVARMAREKAEKQLPHLAAARSMAVLAADTSVVVEGEILGKPRNIDDYMRMMNLLSDRSHRVYSAVALLAPGYLRERLVETRVEFRAVTRAERLAYWYSGEPLDKAGGYALQGRGAVFIRRIEGSHTSVIGLPLCETMEMIAEFALSRISLK